MKPISSTLIEKLNRMENFTLRSGDGNVLWDVNAPGLHVLLVAHQYMKFTGERGKSALLHHSASGDFFNKAYDILTRADLTRDVAPDVWGYIRELNKYASTSRDPEAKASTNVQLFRFIQEFLEGVLYQEYLSRTGREITMFPEIMRKLVVAADQFVVKNHDGGIQIMAGYPWFDQSWGRDSFIALPGMLLATQRFEHAKSVIGFYARHQNYDGRMPNRIFADGRKEYNSADASLWFIEALKRYHVAAKSRDADAFVKRMLPVVNLIMEHYTAPQGDIHLDRDNLVVVPGQWTWMDASPGNRPVTPRYGKPVEIQALFYNALGVAAEFNAMAGNKKLSSQYSELRASVRDAVNARYFTRDRAYPFDVVDGDEFGVEIRPNAVFLVSLSMVDDLLPQGRREGIVDTIEQELLTPYGLRTLSPNDRRYIGRYDTFAPLQIKDLAYHQGTVWPFLMSHYVKARHAVRPFRDCDATAEFVKNRVNSLIYTIKDKDTVPELFCGDEPYAPGGTVSQAWSVAALMEIFDFLNTVCGPQRRTKK